MDFSEIYKDPMREYQRLSELYAAMEDKELEALAQDAGQLTKIAQEILDRELRRRGIEIPPEEEDAATVAAMPSEIGELVIISSFRNSTEAILAKGLIESSGVECFILSGSDDLTEMTIIDRIHYGESPFCQIHLGVRSEDAEAASEILQHPVTEDAEHES